MDRDIGRLHLVGEGIGDGRIELACGHTLFELAIHKAIICAGSDLSKEVFANGIGRGYTGQFGLVAVVDHNFAHAIDFDDTEIEGIDLSWCHSGQFRQNI